MPFSLDRRDFLRFGTVVLGGAGFPALSPAAGRARAKACILLFLDGGPSHIDLWDARPGSNRRGRTRTSCTGR